MTDDALFPAEEAGVSAPAIAPAQREEPAGAERSR